MADYDVFLSYSGADRPAAVEIKAALEGFGLKVWFDQSVLPPGAPWLQRLEPGIKESKSTLILIGSGGVTGYQNVEMTIAVDWHMKQPAYRVTPVLLPGVASDQLPAVLAHYQWVSLRGLADREALERIYWGVTGKPFVAVAPAVDRAAAAPPPPDRNLELAIGQLRDTLRTDNVTFFVGTDVPDASPATAPAAGEIARGLLLDLKLIEPLDNLLPPLDIVGSYYAARFGFSRLEDKLVDMFADRAPRVPEAYERLAALISSLPARQRRRGRPPVQQLIVTTNLDVLLERALLRKGVSFTRLVQHTGSSRIQINQYHGVTCSPGGIQLPAASGPNTATHEQWDKLDEIISSYRQSHYPIDERDALNSGALQRLPVREYSGEGPVLYKLRGSYDVKNSCALSVDQQLKYLRGLSAQNLVPSQIADILNDSPILLVGYSCFDADFRLAYHGLLRRAIELRQDPVYSVQQRPAGCGADLYSRMPGDLWERYKAWVLAESKIHILEASAENVLRRMTETGGDQAVNAA